MPIFGDSIFSRCFCATQKANRQFWIGVLWRWLFRLDRHLWHRLNRKAEHEHYYRRATMADDDEMSFLAPKVVYVQPDNQVQLSQQEMAATVTRNLSWRDPQRILNQVKFSYKEYAYKPMPSQDHDHLAIHFAMDGSALFRDSEEGKAQIELETARKKAQEKVEAEKLQMLANPEMFKLMNKDKKEDEDTGDQQDDQLFVEKNQFNYFDKGCQTWTNPVKELSVSTVQPETAEFSTSIAQWEIYDTYVVALQKELREKQVLRSSKKKHKEQVQKLDEDL